MKKECTKRAGARRRLTGWLLSVVLLAGYCSPQAELLRTLPDTLVIADGQRASIDAAYPLRVIESDVQALSAVGDRLGEEAARGGAAEGSMLAGVALERRVAEDGALDGHITGKPDIDEPYVDGTDAGRSGTAKATISLFGLLPLREVEIQVRDDLRLYPGGQAVGVALHTEGVLVVGTSDLSGGGSPARLAGVKAGDLITEADGQTLTSTDELTALVSRTAGKPLPITVRRGESTLRLTLTPSRDGQTGGYRIGAWVRDSTAGVGTLSFYGEVNEGEGVRYGALGHAITDADTQQVLTVSHGELMLADVVDVRKGASGVPGELKGSFLRERRVLGGIERNNRYGIYGLMSEQPTHPLYPDGLPIGRRDAVHAGAATILCTVGAQGMKEYDVEIVEVARQSAPAQRSMVIKVVDEELLGITGGIVQGMSGSPILQEGRLVGAVTHVFVNDPTMGYGLYIEWMLAAGEQSNAS